jgi:YesN/AraC family two-component response regulator
MGKTEQDILQHSYDFDLATAEKVVKDYSIATGIHCTLIDGNGEPIISGEYDAWMCRFCSLAVGSDQGNSLSCYHAHRYGSYQAERFGGKYTFFCPLGLIHWVSPIMVQGVMQAAILAGPVLIEDKEEFFLDFIRKHRVPKEEVLELRHALDEVPTLFHGRVQALSDLLMLVADDISRQTAEALSERSVPEEEPEEERDESLYSYLPLLKSMGGNVEEDRYPLDKEKELLQYISSGDKEGARSALNEILGHVFFSRATNFDVIKARVLELIVLLSRAALEGGASVDEIFGLNYKYINQIQDFRSVDQLAMWLSRIMIRFSDCVFDLKDVKHVDVIYKALEFIKNNYMNKISLADVAEVAHISPSYFSKIFKEEMGCNFNTYLNEVRVNMSKRLLLDDSISLVDIAFLTGYEDQSYFSKVFKKMTGISPGKYRESKGRKQANQSGQRAG